MKRLLTIAILCLVAPLLTMPAAHASDPLRLDESFGLLHLNPYMKQAETASAVDDAAGEAQEGLVFAIQNSGSQPLDLVLRRAPLNDLAVALRLQSGSRLALRLFSSDNREFAGQTGSDAGLAFFIPGGEVHSFFLPGIAADEVIYLWSPEQLAAHQAGQQTFYSTMLLLLSLLLVLAVIAAVIRRSRRATYGVTMGGGLLVMLASLWLRDILPYETMFDGLLAYRLSIIRIALGLGVFMSILAHVNLVIRLAVNRNYWTRVIIFADGALVATGGLWAAEILAPAFAGVVSAELGDIALAMTCGIVLLGAFFVPDRR